MQTATNPETGEVVVLVGDKWQKAERTATNDKGEKAYLVGGQWMVKGAEPAKPEPSQPAPQQAPFRPGSETIGEFVRQEAQGRGMGAQIVAGAGTALDNAAYRLKQAVAGLTPEDEARVMANRALSSTGAGIVGNIAGNVAMVGGPAMGAQAALTNLGARVLPAAIAPTAAAAATGAGVAAGTNPVLTGESELANAAIGAAGGAVGDTVARGLARAAQPIIQSDAVQTLIRNGVIPTFGQAAGPGSVVSRLEQQLTSFGPLGMIVNSGRDRATKEANMALLKRAIPEGESAAGLKPGREALEKVGGMLDDAYNAVYSRIQGKVTTDSGFDAAVKAIPKTQGIDLPDALAARFNQLVNDRVVSRLGSGGDADAIRAANNSLGELARRYRKSTSPDEQALGKAFAEAKDALRDMVSRQASPDFKEALKALDGKYNALVVLERAADRTTAGVATGKGIGAEAKRGTPDIRQFGQAAREVLGDTVPDSGTAGRMLLPYLLSGGAAGANETFGGPGYLTALALAPLLYSRPVANYAVGNLIPGQAAAAAALRQGAPYASVLGMGISPQFGRQ